jgi:hypothetical protein
MILSVVKIVAVVLLAVKYFTPIEPARKWIVDKLVRLMLVPGFSWVDKIITLITCSMCVSFWTILVIMHSLPLAAIGAIMARIIDLTIEFLNKHTYGN